MMMVGGGNVVLINYKNNCTTVLDYMVKKNEFRKRSLKVISGF
jgi:hypothetical protein